MKVINTFDDWEIGKRTQWTNPARSWADKFDFDQLPVILKEIGFSSLCAEGVKIPKVE
jgi:hypothetical protein